jgi:choline dehydrogenase-like flavoprotein
VGLARAGVGADPDGLTVEEQRLRRVVIALGALFVVLSTSYLVQGVVHDAEFPFVANSVMKDFLLATLCAVAAADLHRFSWAIFVVVAAHVVLIGSLLVTLVGGDISRVEGSFAGPGFDVPSGELIFWIWVGLATAVTLMLALLYRSAARSRYPLRYLSPLQHRTVMALAEVLVPEQGRRLNPEQIAQGVDDYLFSWPAHEKRKIRLALTALALYPLFRLHAPFPLMSIGRRQAFIERCFIADVAERRLPGPIRRLVQNILVAAQQVVFIGYYADERTASETGYVPFSRRPHYSSALQRVKADRPRVDSTSPRELDAERVTADVVIVGSGAGGATLAQRLAEAGREVLVLERGRHVDPSQFSEDERVQFGALFSDGGAQLSTDSRFQVLQGMCVGGSTVVNNAVCFDLPDRVLERWNDPDGLDAGLDRTRLAGSFTRLRDELGVRRQDAKGALGANSRLFAEGVQKLGLDQPPGHFDVVDANINDCLGCGYCNIGCAFGKKLSMLDRTLPEAQARFGTQAVRIFCECRAERIETRNGHASGLRCRLSDGRELRVEANAVVVSAGALASSLLLQRSGVGGELAGRHLCFNMGAPMTGEFDDKLDSYAALQITHYLLPPGEEDLVLETWFNPVGTQALFMPGWFSDHSQNMRNYDRMTCAGSVVGTRRNASVKATRKGMKLSYVPAQDDLERLVRGLKLAGRIFLAAGARRAMPNTFRYVTCEKPEDLDELDRAIRDNTDITVHTSHPQGGNAVSRSAAKGVVDETFRVHGFDNLFVCDASVFPSAITVNPQLTVMALADYASTGIA